MVIACAVGVRKQLKKKNGPLLALAGR